MQKHYVETRLRVNAANVSKDGGKYTIKDVVHAIDGIVLNQRVYRGAELEKAVLGLEGRPAPAGHPKDSKGRHISASNGEALSAAWIGAYCVNSRYTGGRAMCDIVVTESQARAMPAGVDVVNRLDAAIAGTNTDPIAVSSGLTLREVAENGESLGKKYKSIATEMNFDHLAILLNEAPAGTPAEGIGMFVNSAGHEAEIEVVNLDEHEDEPPKGFTAWLRKLLVNTAFLSSLALPLDQKQPPEVEPLSTNEKEDHVKEKILAALNTAGISVTGLDDTQLLTAYNALQAKPATDALTAANSKIAGFELAANAAADAELTGLATALAVNSSLTAEDFKKMGIARLKELSASGKAAPVVVGNSGAPADEFAGYDINAL